MPHGNTDRPMDERASFVPHPVALGARRAVAVGLVLGAWGAACDAQGDTASLRIERARPVVVATADASSDALDGASGPSDALAEGDATPDDVIGPSADTALEDDGSGDDGGVDADASPVWPRVWVGDTAGATRDLWDRYACAPDIDESGAEEVFTFAIERMGILRATVDDVAGDGVDVDVHLLAGDGPESCVRRDNKALAWVVRPGTWRVVVDTWVGGDGMARAGPYRLEVDFVPLDEGPCALEDKTQRMYWAGCAPGIDCEDDGAMRWLRTPSLGPVVGEAHLVTTLEDFPGDGWPSAARDQIERHYAISQAASGYAMARDSDWAPEGEGGSHWGGGATGQKLPVLDEAWYVNMYWRDRPARGRRMLVVEPWSGRAVVAAGGWETGPGSNTAIGGAVEEIHHALDSVHRDDLVMGFLVDDALPLGPIRCW